ncbi:unnamed protein product [Angiostrongylus costaricensis]|uniref:BPL/LPL catalytic domain-containing protein n=1 Tax=Angiostrongylus costaricensis TaxID=334426 RepID=A0A0R3PES5_ANGCS|nr:unnamed protein product [Angiostrongylus costaricensis]
MCKPPSILVYTGGQNELYARIRDSLSRLIPADRYTVFHLSPEAMKKQPWMEPTTACLVVADTSDLDDQSWSNMQLYFNQANMIRMAFGSRDSISMGKDFEHFLKKSLKTLSKHGEINTKFHSKDFAGAMSYSVVLSKVKDMPLFLYMENSAHQASAIFSDATSEQLLSPGIKILPEALSRVGVEVVECTPLALTQAVMTASEDPIIENMMKTVKGVRYGEEIGQTPKLFFRKTERAVEQGMPEVSEKLLPVEVLSRNSDHPDIGFDFSLYFTRLQTRQLGHVIVYVPVATTTMDINESLCDAIPTCQGAVVVARRQVSGKARTPSFIQHIFAVAVVDAVHRLSGLDDFPLRIKWPNDFYFNRSHKVGGLLATAKVRDDGLLISIGAGINVANSRPTVCLNDMVPDGSSTKFSVEEVIAETLNCFEYWLNMCEIKGQAEVLKTYYRFWLHRMKFCIEDAVVCLLV